MSRRTVWPYLGLEWHALLWNLFLYCLDLIFMLRLPSNLSKNCPGCDVCWCTKYCVTLFSWLSRLSLVLVWFCNQSYGAAASKESWHRSLSPKETSCSTRAPCKPALEGNWPPTYPLFNVGRELAQLADLVCYFASCTLKPELVFSVIVFIHSGK